MSDYAVISDVHIQDSADMTLAEFSASIRKASPVGFGIFKPFVAGDYTYTNALFKHGLTAMTADRPRLKALTASVDVPDVFDRGQAVIPAATTTVNFNRTFLVAPEVFPVLKIADDTAFFRVSDITTTGFDITIKNASLTVIGATIAWTAIGY